MTRKRRVRSAIIRQLEETIKHAGFVLGCHLAGIGSIAAPLLYSINSAEY